MLQPDGLCCAACPSPLSQARVRVCRSLPPERRVRDGSERQGRERLAAACKPTPRALRGVADCAFLPTRVSAAARIALWPQKKPRTLIYRIRAKGPVADQRIILIALGGCTFRHTTPENQQKRWQNFPMSGSFPPFLPAFDPAKGRFRTNAKPPSMYPKQGRTSVRAFCRPLPSQVWGEGRERAARTRDQQCALRRETVHRRAIDMLSD